MTLFSRFCILILFSLLGSLFADVYASSLPDEEVNRIYYLKNDGYSLNELASLSFTSYEKSPSSLYRFPFEGSSSYWVKFPVSHSSENAITRYIRFSYPDVASVRFYWGMDDERPTELPPLGGNTRLFASKLALEPGEKGWVFLKVDSYLAPIVFNVHLMGNHSFYMKEVLIVALHSVFIGAMTFAALYFLVTLTLVKKFVYLLYILHILAFAAFQGFVQGYPRLLFQEFAYLNEIKVITMLVGFTSFIFFVMHFLREHLPITLRLSIYACLSVGASANLLHILGFLKPDVFMGLGMLCYVLVMLGSFYAYRQGNPYALSICVSTFIISAGAFYQALAVVFQVIPLHEYTLYSLSFSNTLEVLVILLMFVVYFKNTFKQKEKALNDKLSLELSFSRKLENEVAAKTTELEKAKSVAERLARTDELTQLFNRRAFLEQASRCIHDAHRDQRPLSLILLDIDHFKKINDHYGHDAGDVVLQHFAEYLKASVRSKDIVARFGGEEFIVLLPNTDTSAALSLAEDIRRGISELSVGYGSSNIGFTASVGVSLLTGKQDSFESLFSRTDTALYKAKNLGRNRVEFMSLNEMSHV